MTPCFTQKPSDFRKIGDGCRSVASLFSVSPSEANGASRQKQNVSIYLKSKLIPSHLGDKLTVLDIVTGISQSTD